MVYHKQSLAKISEISTSIGHKVTPPTEHVQRWGPILLPYMLIMGVLKFNNTPNFQIPEMSCATPLCYPAWFLGTLALKIQDSK